jgi:flagellin
MPINSVQTNNSAMVALQTLNLTNTQLQGVQKQVSTGFRVADATDDGAAYAIAQGIRSTVGSLTSANQQLNGIQGLLSTTQSSLNNISNTMTTMRGLVVKLGDDTTSSQDRTNYEAQYTALAGNLTTFVQDSNYNGKTLIDSAQTNAVYGASTSTAAGIPTGTTGINVARNDGGQNFFLQNFDAAGAFTTGTVLTAPTSAAAAQALITSTVSGGVITQGLFDAAATAVNGALNTVGSEVNSINSQVSYNSDKMDALNSGVGSLVDADLAQESAQLQALQIRQQLGTQSLSIANQAPAALLSLFK